MYPFFLLGIQAYEAKIELLHAGNVPLEGFEDYVVAGRDIDRTFECLLCADQYPVRRPVESVDNSSPFFE